MVLGESISALHAFPFRDLSSHAANETKDKLKEEARQVEDEREWDASQN
jgi:hypothetical protein